MIVYDRPIVFYDIESTGTDPKSVRIIQLAAIRVDPGDPPSKKTKVWIVNPEVPIPPECTKIHGYSDEDVADKPVLADVADEMLEFFGDAIVSGYNIKSYDNVLMDKELKRVLPDGHSGRDAFEDRDSIDSFQIFKQREGMTLTTAYRFYTGKTLEDAHDAMADTVASGAVLQAQVAEYDGLPSKVSELMAAANRKPRHFVDESGRFQWKDGEVVLAFSKFKGDSLKKVAEIEPGFLKWMLKSDFPEDTKGIARGALTGQYPEASSSSGE